MWFLPIQWWQALYILWTIHNVFHRGRLFSRICLFWLGKALQHNSTFQHLVSSLKIMPIQWTCVRVDLKCPFRHWSSRPPLPSGWFLINSLHPLYSHVSCIKHCGCTTHPTDLTPSFTRAWQHFCLIYQNCPLKLPVFMEWTGGTCEVWP